MKVSKRAVFGILIGLIALQCVIFWVYHHEEWDEKARLAQRPKHPTGDMRMHGIRHHKNAKIAIITIDPGNRGPTPNFKVMQAYANRWGYDVIEASGAVAGALTELRKHGGNPLFAKAFALLRFMPRYEWLLWHDMDAIFLNHSRSLDDFIDSHYDMILTGGPCGSGAWEKLINTGHMLVRNTPMSIKVLKSVWGLWNHTHCKYGETQLVSNGAQLCTLSSEKKPIYYQGDAGALMSVLSHCEECDKKIKFTGFRMINSLYPCHGQGDLVIHVPSSNITESRRIVREFLKNSNFSTGQFKVTPDTATRCAAESLVAHNCTTQKECDRAYHSLNRHRRCPGGHGHSENGDIKLPRDGSAHDKNDKKKKKMRHHRETTEKQSQ